MEGVDALENVPAGTHERREAGLLEESISWFLECMSHVEP